jgi:hypothetical protein
MPIELASEGTSLRVEWPFGGSVEARVVSLPFIDPKKDIPAGRMSG